MIWSSDPLRGMPFSFSKSFSSKFASVIDKWEENIIRIYLYINSLVTFD